MLIKTIQNVFLFLFVLLLANISCLNELNIESNGSNAGESLHSSINEVDSLNKSDHNFYSPIVEPPLNHLTSVDSNSSYKSSVTKKSSKKSKTCPSFLSTIRSDKRQCLLLKKTCYKINAKSEIIKNLSEKITLQIVKPENFVQTNSNIDFSISQFPEETKSKNLSSQEEKANQSKQNDALVNDIILIKSSHVSAQDMLSFEEWRRKISEQMEQSKTIVQQVDKSIVEQSEDNSLNSQNPPQVKLSTNRARNFASHECGAKIVGSNSDADFVNRVLNEQMDEYMLNPCKTTNWFVIELCETIQPQYFEIANFELYSSVPKEFAVYSSESYPNRNEWSLLGIFNASDVRSLQGFKLHNNGFVKFLKVHLLSYYGSEHFCPISLVRVFGTSLFDEVERIDKSEPKPIEFVANEDKGTENAIFEESLQTSPNQDIIGSAKNAVYNIVVKALNFKIFNRILENFSNVKDSTVNLYQQSQVIKMYSSFETFLTHCECFFNSENNSTSNIPSKCIFLRLLFNDQLFDMFYTQYFIRKYINNQLFFQCSANETYFEFNSTSLALKFTNSIDAFSKIKHLTSNKSSLFTLSNNSVDSKHTVSNMIENLNTSFASSIVSSIPPNELSSNLTLESSLIQPTLIQTVINTIPLQTSMGFSISDSDSSVNVKINDTLDASTTIKTDSVPLPSSIFVESDMDIQALSSFSGQSKEAVIIRLTNRIKNLEKNISLMSTYLENLSVRYRKQMEEMQSIFNQTIDHLNNTAIRAAEKDLKQQELLMMLDSEITKLKTKLYDVSFDFNSNNWVYIQIHILLMIFELLLVGILCIIFYIIFRRNFTYLAKTNVNIAKVTSQTNSNPGVNLSTLSTPQKKRFKSKSLSDIRMESFMDFLPISEKTKITYNKVKQLVDTDCDSYNKENRFYPDGNARRCNRNDSNRCELNSSSNCMKNILKTVN